MAFVINLQYNRSEPERIDKNITNIAMLFGELVNETSIIDPILRVECDITQFAGCNYATVDAFGRSYFITDIKSVRDGIADFYGHCDVLSTYKLGIRSNSAIIRKQAGKWNLYLNDGSFKIYQNPIVLTKEFPSGFNTQEIVLAVAGG